MATEPTSLGPQSRAELLTTSDGNLSSAASGTSVKLIGSYTEIKFSILASNTPSFTAIIEHSPDDINYETVGTFNGGPITSAGLFSLSPAAGAGVLPFVRVRISAYTSGQIDQTDSNGATILHYVKFGR